MPCLVINDTCNTRLGTEENVQGIVSKNSDLPDFFIGKMGFGWQGVENANKHAWYCEGGKKYWEIGFTFPDNESVQDSNLWKFSKIKSKKKKKKNQGKS